MLDVLQHKHLFTVSGKKTLLKRFEKLVDAVNNYARKTGKTRVHLFEDDYEWLQVSFTNKVKNMDVSSLSFGDIELLNGGER